MARISFTSLALTSALGMVGLLTHPAQAGFEFVGAPPAATAPAPAQPDYPEWGRPDMAVPSGMSMTPTPAASVVGEALDEAAHQTAAPQSIIPAPAPAAAAPAGEQGYVPSAADMMMAAPAPAPVPAMGVQRGLVSQAPTTTPMPSAPTAVQGTPSTPWAPAPQAMAAPVPLAPVARVEAAPAYDPVPRYIRRDPAAAAPTLNMNPSAQATPASMTDPAVERAMLAVSGGLPPAATPVKSGFGGMPLPSANSSVSGSYTEAVGFGRDLPLALAVSQILPPDYAFSFGNGVNPGDSVSWEGGRPWNAVLNEALASVGASASIDDARKEVTISAGGSSYQPAAYQAPRAPVAAPTPAPAAAYVPPASAAVTPLDYPAASPINMAPAASAVLQAPAPVAPSIKLAGTTSGNALDKEAKSNWTAERGTSLRAILTDWALRAGVELFWSSDFDFPVESTIRISGTFEEAVQTLLTGLRDAQPRPVGRLHPNLPDGPAVLVIETQHIIQ